jgi:Flp pilus assembly protein TadD
MSEFKLAEFKEDFALFIEAGFIAVKQLDETSALRIFDAAQVLSPDHSAPKIGMGYIALNKLEVKLATKIFTEVTEKEPTNWLAQTFLGICYLLTKPKRKKGEKLIREAMEKSGDEAVKNLGTISLEWAQKDLYKSKAPFFAAKEQESLEK